MGSWAEIPRSPGHVFYDKLQAVLIAAGFDAFETQCAKEYAPRRGRPSLPPGRYFRMLLPVDRVLAGITFQEACYRSGWRP